MPVWPAEGSVGIIDEVIVVNFGVSDIIFAEDERGWYFRARHWISEGHEQHNYRYSWQVFRNGKLLRSSVTDIDRLYPLMPGSDDEYRITVMVTNETMNFNYPSASMVLTADNHNVFPYEFSEIVYFDDLNKSYDRFYIRGLSWQEENGVWSEGKETEFLFYLPPTQNELRLLLDVAPFSVQKVELVANGVSLGVLEINEAGLHEITIPNETIIDNKLHLLFLLPNALSPKDLGINNDERELSLFFHELSISEKQISFCD